MLVDGHEVEGLLDSRLFTGVAPESVEGVLRLCRIRDLSQGETLLVPEQSNALLYVVASGAVSIHLGNTKSEPIVRLGVGETVGEMSLLDGGSVSAFVVADEPSRLVEIEEDLLWTLVHVSHAAACNLLTILVRRLRNANHLIEDRTALFDSLREFGSIDALTGLHNRHWFDQVLRRNLTRCQITGKPLSLIMADLDNFKVINDGFGHLAGDRAIRAVGQLIVKNSRPTTQAARFGGDEFVIILPDIDVEQAAAIAERLRLQVAAVVIEDRNGTQLPPLTISAGVAEARAGAMPEGLIAATDAALLRAKSGGRNRVCI